MKRRGFLKLTGLAIVAATIPSMATTINKYQMFTLVGDGVTDDTLAMQSLLDGNSVIFEGAVFNGKAGEDTIFIPKGNFVISSPVIMGGM